MSFFPHIQPHPALRPYVRHYLLLHIQLGSISPDQRIKPIPPDAEQSLFFYPRSAAKTVVNRNGETRTNPSSIFVGQQTSRINILFGEDHLIIQVCFRPGFLYQLLGGMSATEFQDKEIDAECLMDNGINELNNRLREETDYRRMIDHIEAYLLKKINSLARSLPLQPIDKVILAIKDTNRSTWPHTSYAKMASLRDENAMIAEFKGMTQALLKAGVTSYQNMCSSGATATDYARIWQKAGLPFRLRLIRWGDMNVDGSLSIPAKDQPKTIPDLPLLTVSGTKWLLEGTPLEGGAEQVDPYPNRPGWYGRMNYSVPEIERMCREAIARKDQLHFHIGGTRSIGKLLDLMAAMPVDWKALRPRFEHGDEIDYLPEYLKKAQAMGVIIVQNPTHFAPIEGFPMGPPPTHGMAMKTLLNDHIPLAIGSDGPFNPYLNIMFATTHPRRPSEALSREQAVIAYTRTAAYAEFAEQEKGTLTVGKVADLAVLSQNIFKVPIPKLLQTESVLTMVNGVVVYDAGLLKIN